MKPLTIQEFISLKNNGSEVLDTRDIEDFKQGFIPGSIGITLKSKFAEYITALVSKKTSLVFIANAGQEPATNEALTNAGYNNIAGYLQGGFNTWVQAGEPTDMIIDVEPDELMMDIPFDENLVILDVRRPIEFAEGHLKDAVNIPLSDMADPLKIAQIEEKDNLYIHCAAGVRSVIASSYLKKHGIHNLRNIIGGWDELKQEPKAQIVKEPDVLN